MELVTFGEAMLRLTPVGGEPLARANRLDLHVGGSELNVAVAASKLGVATRWVSRLPDNPIGHIIADRAQEQGVDVSCISWSPDGRAGVYYVELNAETGVTNVTYDRSGSAMARVGRGMIDWNRAMRDATWFHVSGITPALSESAAQTLLEGIQAAERIGLTISYDLGFRPKLWRPERARAAQESLFRYVDLLIASDRGARLVFSAPDYTPEDLARGIHDRYGIPSVAISVRNGKRAHDTNWSAVVVADGQAHGAPSFDTRVVEPLGAGDAFAAGLIYGRLRGETWDVAARHGAALAAKKHATPGEFSRATAVT